MAKKPRSDPALDIIRNNDASGLKLSLHGVIYQVKLLMLVVKRADGLKYDFRLASEMDAAEKLDDIVLKYKRMTYSSTWNWRFIQALVIKRADDLKYDFHLASEMDAVHSKKSVTVI